MPDLFNNIYLWTVIYVDNINQKNIYEALDFIKKILEVYSKEVSPQSKEGFIALTTLSP